MQRKYKAGYLVHSLLERLVSEGKAKLVRRSVDNYTAIYSVIKPEVAVISQQKSSFLESDGYLCDVIGREEDVQQFEEDYQLVKEAQ